MPMRTIPEFGEKCEPRVSRFSPRNKKEKMSVESPSGVCSHEFWVEFGDCSDMVQPYKSSNSTNNDSRVTYGSNC